MTILIGDNRTTLPTIERGSVQCIATSPPYFGLRLYGDADEEIGKERDLGAYVQSIVDVMRLCRDALRDDGVAWVNLGDSYASQTKGSWGKGKSGLGTRANGEQSLTDGGRDRAQARQAHEPISVDCGTPDSNALLVPFRVAMALQQDGWTLRAMLPWVKLTSMPESVQSRPSMAHEYVLFLTKRPSGYFYDADAVRVPHVRLWGANNGGTMAHNGGAHEAAARAGAGHQGNAHRGAYPLPNPAGRSLRSSDFWRASARSAAEQLHAAADGEATGLITNDDAPAALVVNPKGSGIEHFAMWPTRLVAPMIMAGTPEAGSCSVCGAPWERVVNAHTESPSYRQGNAPIRHMASSAAGQGQTRLERSNLGMVRAVQTIGFRPSCPHADAPARPAIVLDPFVGAGTTIGVAEALGRQAIGCELYQKNADLLPRRTEIVRAEVAEYLRERAQGDKAAAIEAEARGQISLFGSAT